MLHTAESNFSNLVIEYLGEIESEFENTLAFLSGAHMGSNHEKNWRSKLSWHTPFKPTDICAHAMPRAKKGQQNVPILKKTTGLCPSGSYYAMILANRLDELMISPN